MVAAVALGAGALGVAIGLPLRRRLRERRYAVTPTERAPSGHRWVPAGLALALLLLTARVAADQMWGLAPAYVVLAVVGVSLAAIDLDVHRLPDRLTLRTAPLLFVLLGLATLVHDDAGSMLPAVLSWAGALLVFGALVLLVPSGMGLGDAKLAALVALVLGWWGYAVAIVGLALGFVVGGVWALVLMLARRATRHTHFAFGPSILLGALLALLIAVPAA